MQITKRTVVFDTADLESESTFWARLLGGEVRRDDDWHDVVVDGEGVIAAQLAPNHVQPEWPDGQPQQVHLDLYVTDIRHAHDEAVDAGARELQVTHPFDAPEGFRVYASPAGHPFCLCWG